jgi:uncharacterized protein with FMN-binding domain
MRRAAAAVLGTIFGTTLLVGAKIGTRPPGDLDQVVAAPPADSTPGTPAPSGAPAASGSPTTTPSRSSGPSPAPTAVKTTTAPAPTRPAASRSAAPPKTGGSGLRTGTFAGTAVTHKYGTVKVTITVSGGRMTNATATYTASTQVSEKINADAMPKLRSEALVAQSANIATVSGATYTSGAYRSSLQAALDRAGG